MAHDRANRSFSAGVSRGLKLRCPNCGQGGLYRKYLKVQDCPACGNANSVYRADDGPAYITILLIGHLVIAPLLLWPWIWEASPGLVVGTVIPALAVLTLALLPVIKGGWVGFLWSQR